MTIYFPNLNFEDELSGKPFRVSSQTQAAIDDLSPLMGLLALPGDTVIVNPGAIPGELPDCLNHVRFDSAEQICSRQNHDRAEEIIAPWGWTSQVNQAAEDFGLPAQHVPDLSVVKHVNSREFSAGFDAVHGDADNQLQFGDENFGRLCLKLDECHQAISLIVAAGFSRWVAKPQLSHAGRNRLLVTGSELNYQQHGWLVKQLDQGGVYLEPWTQPITESGLQFYVHSPNATSDSNRRGDVGQIDFIGATQLVNDEVGRYSGSMIEAGENREAECAPSIEYGFQVCRAAQSAGYFGPVGIDSFRFRNPQGGVSTRLCNDVNARFTMGRVALSLRQKLQEKHSGLWCQLPVGQQLNRPKTNNSASLQELIATMQNVLTAQGENDVFIERTSPLLISDRCVRTVTVMLSGPNSTQLLKSHALLRQFVKDQIR